MGQGLVSVKPLPDFRLEMEFRNGSKALVNLENRVRTVRFHELSSAELFASAKAVGDKVVWSDGVRTFGVYCNEILDAMMMD